MPTTSWRRALARDPSYGTHDQASIALFVAQLDDQARRLEAAVADLPVAVLEWQPGPGRNSVGMLLAHIAITETFWIGVASGRTTDPPSAEALSREVLGLGRDDDGMPAPPDGGHPAALAGWDLARYLDLLHRARRFLRVETAAWDDASLASCARWRDYEVTREWVLYHLLEHFAQHAGQVALLVALARPRGGA